MSHPTPYLEEKRKIPSIMKTIFDHSLRYLERERYSWTDLLSLQKSRKKIFTDYTRTKSVYSERKPTSYTNLSSTKFSNTIPKPEAEIVHHIICQCESLSQELINLVGYDCHLTFFNTTRNYLIEGFQYRRIFLHI